MTKEEQKQCEETYLQKALGLLGHRLKVFDVKWYGGHPVAQVVYWDYKVSIITRAELQQLMPEVEFATVKREFSDAAFCHQLFLIMVNVAPSVTIDGTTATIQEHCERLLYDTDLSTESLRYDENEKEYNVVPIFRWDEQ